jgi:hypothetical protein
MGKRVLLAGYYLAFGLFLIAAALSRPQFNWDIIPYLGATGSFEIQDKQALHASVFDELARFVPASAYQSLVTGSDYRVAVATDPEAFSQQLPFYQPRVLYIGLLFLLSKLGLNVVMVTYLISAVSVALGLWVLFVAFHRTLSGYLLLLFPVLALGMGVLDLARLSTADGLAFLAIARFLSEPGLWQLWLAHPILPQLHREACQARRGARGFHPARLSLRVAGPSKGRGLEQQAAAHLRGPGVPDRLLGAEGA